MYDALGPGLTLLRLDPEADPSPFVVAAAARDTPLHVVDLCMLGCPRTVLGERYGATMLLVRPTNTSHGGARNRQSTTRPLDVLDK